MPIHFLLPWDVFSELNDTHNCGFGLRVYSESRNIKVHVGGAQTGPCASQYWERRRSRYFELAVEDSDGNCRCYSYDSNAMNPGFQMAVQTRSVAHFGVPSPYSNLMSASPIRSRSKCLCIQTIQKVYKPSGQSQRRHPLLSVLLVSSGKSYSGAEFVVDLCYR